MGWSPTRGPALPAGPRKNQWKGLRAKEAITQRAAAGQARAAARRMRYMRWAGIMTVVVLSGWVIVTGVQYSRPTLKRLLQINTVTVEGLHRIDRKEVIDRIGLQPDTALHHIVPEKIKQQVVSHPWVKEATVSRVWFHELRISVIERKPAAVIRAASENFLSDDSGHMLARLGQADDDALPMLTGIDPQALLRGEERVRQTIMSGIELAKLVGHTYEGRLQVNVENPANLVASVRGVQFQFGEEPVNEQWERFRRVKPTLKTLNFDGQGGAVQEVDLRYENRIIVRERG